MAGLAAPRGRILPELLSVLAVYALLAVGGFVLASQVLAGAPAFPDLEEGMPALLLAILPLSLAAIFAARAWRLVADLRARRYGARLRARLSGLFLLAMAAASLPQGLFLLRLARYAQSAASAAEAREALASGQALALAWYDEELGRVGLAAASLPGLPPRARVNGPSGVLEELRRRDPRMAAVELFREGESVGFAGDEASRLASPPEPPGPESPGHALPSSAGPGRILLRYAARWDPAGLGGFTVLSLALPEGLESSAALLGRASREAQAMGPFSERWSALLAAVYGAFVLPLLLLSSILALSAADLVAEPLSSLEAATHRVAAGDYGVRLLVKPGDETGRLVASFNRMLSEIERYRAGELRQEKIDAWQDIAQRLAHELKNPLTPIRLAAERVLKRWREDPAQAGSIVEGSMLAIVKEVEGMDALLTDFRAFASLPEPERDWAELRGLVEEAVALYAASYPGVRFELGSLPAGVKLRVDHAAMKRALGNLLSNAVDAMGGEGRVEIGADLVKAADSRYCRLRLRDTGRGIPAELRDKVFEPYFTTKSAGTGLGLSIVERIVADQGGSVRFESEEGIGTTFFLDLPMDR
ncbi:MAG TPA: ATP-binding protein [Spirochaetales bacterium]|nr:ATP-binding protein [Spirochaetales bacterium]HRY55025.1 ATP-binding protein [Spirochaetia bacterium]